MRRKRGISLIEALIAFFVLAVGLLSFLAVASNSLKEATRLRDEILADETLMNTMEEVHGARFGDKNRWWKQGAALSGPPEKAPDSDIVNLKIALEGRSVQSSYVRRVEVATQNGGTGAFFGQAKGDYDVLKISVYWHETTGEKTKTAYLTVRRRPDER
jgi:hypothetical protein